MALSQVITETVEAVVTRTMKALVYHGPGKKGWEDKPRPVLRDATDAIVRITTSTICGTDIHILKGDVPTATEGRILGHEGVGVVEETGAAVTTFRAGGNIIDGIQAEYARGPGADTSLYPVAANDAEEAFVMLSDILPTGFESHDLLGRT